AVERRAGRHARNKRDHLPPRAADAEDRAPKRSGRVLDVRRPTVLRVGAAVPGASPMMGGGCVLPRGCDLMTYSVVATFVVMAACRRKRSRTGTRRSCWW